MLLLNHNTRIKPVTVIKGIISVINTYHALGPVVVTGSVLKYPPVLKEFDVSPVSVELDKLSQGLRAVLK